MKRNVKIGIGIAALVGLYLVFTRNAEAATDTYTPTVIPRPGTANDLVKNKFQKPNQPATSQIPVRGLPNIIFNR